MFTHQNDEISIRKRRRVRRSYMECAYGLFSVSEKNNIRMQHSLNIV